ncbi:MAG: hypothetical protein IPN71_01370 [Fibrobacteres bacterium]|nr:hypothetical protein [Fibrobacterota bacterium]
MLGMDGMLRPDNGLPIEGREKPPPEEPSAEESPPRLGMDRSGAWTSGTGICLRSLTDTSRDTFRSPPMPVGLWTVPSSRTDGFLGSKCWGAPMPTFPEAGPWETSCPTRVGTAGAAGTEGMLGTRPKFMAMAFPNDRRRVVVVVVEGAAGGRKSGLPGF